MSLHQLHRFTIAALGGMSSAMPSTPPTFRSAAHASPWLRRPVLAAGVVLLLWGCRGTASDADVVPPGDSSELVAAATVAPTASAPQKRGARGKAGDRIKIAAGKVTLGSLPGDPGRHPAFEAMNQTVDVGAFEIDRLPFPNDPKKRPRTKVSRKAAAAACDQAGGRLCTDVEWERACRGPDGHDFAGSDAWNEDCAGSSGTCASGFDVLGQGASIREWTSSEIPPIKNFSKRAAAVKGAGAKEAGLLHRCARRMPVAFADEEPDLGFRCCYGEPTEIELKPPKWSATFRDAPVTTERLAKLLGSNDKLKRLAADLVFFRNEGAGGTIKRRAKDRPTWSVEPNENLEFGTQPMRWNPAPGETIVVVAGRSGPKTSFVLAFHELPGERYRLAASMVMENEIGPVVFVYDKYQRRQLQWSTCWPCYGETGNITYRKDNRVSITQR